MRVNSKKMFLTLKKEVSYKTRQHQSYLELKKDTNEEFVRKALFTAQHKKKEQPER